MYLKHVYMWHYISGKLITIFIFSLIFKQLINNTPLEITDKLFGWFLLEHVYEDYNKTTGKLFMVNEDFRRLIKNLFKIIRNVFFWGQLITLTEFFLLTLIPIMLLIFLNTTLTNKNANNKSKDIFYLYYYIFFIVILIIKIKITFTIYDLISIIKLLIMLCLANLLIYILNFTFNLTNYYITCFNKNYLNKLIAIKTYFYLSALLFLFCILLVVLTNYDKTSNNYVLELSTQLIYLYAYLNYYFLTFENYKNANYKSIMQKKAIN